MINKYQQGGAAPQLGGGILAQIQSLPQDQLKQIMSAFAQWAQQKGVDIQQLQQDPAMLEQALGQFMQEMQSQQAQMARQGAKLKFIKGLKHQCAEDEELKYFKVGGTIGCNCVKKHLTGGPAEPKKNAIQKFKDQNPKAKLNKKNKPRTKEELAKIDKLSELDYFGGKKDHGDNPPDSPALAKTKKDKCGGKMKKHQIGGTLEQLKKSLGL